MTDPLTTVRLGRSAVVVTRLGLGTAPLGGWPTAIPPGVGVATVQRAWDEGLRYFDTAPYYGSGNSESYLGAVLPRHPRDSFAVSTKVGYLLRPGAPDTSLYEGVRPFTPVHDYSAAGVERSLVSSRERLGLDRVDIALVHDPDDYLDEVIAVTTPALVSLRDAGELGAVGAGMVHTAPLTQLCRSADLDCVLEAGRYTLLEQGPLDDLLPAALETDTAVIAGGVLNSGLLADPDDDPHYDYARASGAVVDRARALARVCREHDVPLRAVAMQFPLAHPAVASVVVGARTPDEVSDALTMMRVEIPGELWAALRSARLVRDDAPTP